MLIRIAQLSDILDLVILCGQLGYKTNVKEAEQRFQILLQEKEHAIFVAVENKKVIAWIHAFFAVRVESDLFVEIAALVVDEKYRKAGIGKKLIEEVENWAKEKNCYKIRVRCNVTRKESHGFYKNLGFKEIKEQKVFSKNVR